MSIPITSINIEGGKHLERVQAFVSQHQPEVICLQEVFSQDIPWLENAFGMKSFFTANADVSEPVTYMPTRGQWGNAIFSAVPITHKEEFFYAGLADALPILKQGNPNSGRRSVQIAEVEKDAKIYRFANTHLTWTPEGSVTEEQLKDARALLKFLEQFPEIIVVGDFNAPRGKETFSLFAERYTDNIPADVISSLDPELHRAGALPFMVDGLFTSPGYRAENVAVHAGVSDHRAIVAQLTALGL